VRLETTATKSGKDWTDLVCLPCKPTEDSDNRSLIAGWLERHTQCGLRAWPWSSPRQWADVTAPCQQSRQRAVRATITSVVLSRSAGCWDLTSHPFCLCVRVEQTWLLQCNTSRSSKVYYWQRAQNAAARLVTRLGPRDHVSDALRSLHWLPVQERITYELCLLMHLVHNNRAPSYLADSVTATANLSRRTRLRSASAVSIRYSNQAQGWNSASAASLSLGRRLGTLFRHSIQLSDTESFKRHLKTVLFQRCYCCSTLF